MSSAIRAATRVQIGKETTRGTLVVATRRLIGKDFTYRIIQEMEEHEGQVHGTLARAVVAPTLTRQGTEFEISSDLDFDQILFPWLSGVKGGVTPTTPGTGEARLWTFTPSVSTDPLPTTYTLEWAERDMDASPNEEGFEAGYGFTTAWGIAGGEDGVPQINMSMIARKSASAASTAALSVPTPLYGANAKWKVYADSSWANLGNTQVSGQIYGFGYQFSDFLRAEHYHDGRADLDFSQYEFAAGRLGDLTFEAVVDPNSGFIPTERAIKDASTMRFVRLQIDGPAFDSPDNGLNRFIRIDGAYYHAPDSMVERGRDRNGNVGVSVHLKSAYDSVQAQDMEFVAQNNLAAFP